jgi:site-specific DNA-methyltransferase (adenine-specific)
MIINGDCHLELQKLQAKSVDIVLCDPPYATTKNLWDQPLNWDVVWEQLTGIVKPNGAIVLFSQFPFSADLVHYARKKYKHYWVWDKKLAGNFAVTKYMPLSVTELILVFTAYGEKVKYYPQMTKDIERYRGSKKAKTNGQGFGNVEQIYYKSDERFPKNILEFSAVNRRQSKHPSQKPVKLLEYLIKTYSREGETILDFTMGSGSTGVACKNTNREFIGIENDLGYFNIAKERLNA